MRITLVSFFESQNIGDITITKAIIEQLLKNDRITNILLVNYSNASTMKNTQSKINWTKSQFAIEKGFKYNVKKILPMNYINKFRYYYFKKKRYLQIKEILKDTDYVIIGGGNMLMDIFPEFIDKYFEYLNVAKELNIPFSTILVGAGPIIHESSKNKLIQFLTYNNYISVRDELSYITLKNYFKGPISITPDPVFSLELSTNKKNSRDINLIGINALSEVCFKNENEYNLYYKFLEKVISVCKKVYNPDILKIFSTDTIDYKTMNNLYEKYKNINKMHIELVCLNDLSEVDNFLNEIDFVIGGRMHAMIFCQLKCIPFIAVNWQPKVAGFGKIVNEEDKLLDFKKNYTDFELEQIIESALAEGYFEKKKSRNFELREQVIKESQRWIT